MKKETGRGKRGRGIIESGLGIVLSPKIERKEEKKERKKGGDIENEGWKSHKHHNNTRRKNKGRESKGSGIKEEFLVGVGGGADRKGGKPPTPTEERVSPEVNGERKIKKKSEIRITFFNSHVPGLTSFLIEKTKKKEKEKELDGEEG